MNTRFTPIQSFKYYIKNKIAQASTNSAVIRCVMYVRVAGGLAPHPEVVELSILHLNLILKRTTNIKEKQQIFYRTNLREDMPKVAPMVLMPLGSWMNIYVFSF